METTPGGVREERMSNKKSRRLEQEDPLRKLPLYLSEYALNDFNMTQYAGSCYTLKKDEFYESVDVVDSLIISSCANNTTTYLITFEASLPANNTTQTFVTKVSFSPLSTVRIGFCFVKIKGEETHHEEEVEEEKEYDLSDSVCYEDDPDIDSESSESDVEVPSQENHLKFHKKDSQENLSDFGTDGVHSKYSGKSLSQSDEKRSKDFNEKLFRLDEKQSKDSKENLSKFGEREPSGEYLSQFDNEKHSNQNLPEIDGKDTRKRRYCHPDTNFKHLEYKYEGSELSKEIESFRSDVAKSDGFEVGHYPLMDDAGIRGTWIYKFYDRETKTLGTTDMNELVCLSRLAICVYNMEKDTYFDNVKVLKAMTSGGAGVMYNLTFEASLPDHTTETFQTRIFTAIPLPCAKIEIEFVRVKPN